MDNVSVFLLTIAGIFLVGVAGELVFERTHVPDAAWLVGVGIVLGPATGLLRREWLLEIAPFFAALTLIVILFDGGRHLRGGELGRSALPAAWLALLTFGLSAATVALLAQVASAVGWLPAPWSLQHSLLLGAILGGSSSVVIMPSMRVARVEPRTAAVVSLESAITDVLCVVGAGALTQLIVRGAGAAEPAAVIGRTFGLGLGIGAAAGAIWMLCLRVLRRSRHAFPLTLAGLLLLYVLVDRSGGSAALGVLTFAVLVGNSSWILRRAGLGTDVAGDIEHSDIYGQLVFIVKSFFFTFIGAMLGPPWGLAALGVVMGLALLPARLPGAWLAARALRLDRRGSGLVSVSLPRGLAAGVLATLPAAAGVPGTASLPGVVFPAVIATIVVFAIGFRLAGREEAPEAGAVAPAGPTGEPAAGGGRETGTP